MQASKIGTCILRFCAFDMQSFQGPLPLAQAIASLVDFQCSLDTVRLLVVVGSQHNVMSYPEEPLQALGPMSTLEKKSQAALNSLHHLLHQSDSSNRFFYGS